MKQIFCFLLSLSCFAGQAFAQTPTELKSYLPQVSGWKITPEIEIFNRDNLYERINGAAPLFLENNFQEMTSMEYTKENDYITIQAYRHGKPEDAFGMYASERSSDMKNYAIGGEAQGDDYGLYFFSGSVYVKITANNEGFVSEMQQIAEGLTKKIDSQASYPKIFDKFPKENRVPYSEAYITQNYIGHEFLKFVYTLNYKINEKTFQAFVIDAKTKENAKKILTEYFKFTKQTENFSEGKLLIKDRYNGNIPIIWNTQYIAGAFDENGEDFPEDIYAFLAKFLF